MANRIKGITIEFDGNTVKLQNALKEVNNMTRQTQTALTDVNRLLKIDPGNTTLLSQKQKLLADQIQNTRLKLNELNTAYDRLKASGVDENSAEMQALKREIIDTESKLKALEKQMSSFGSVGAQKIAAVGEKMKDMGGKVEQAGKSLSKVSAVTGAALGASMKFASDFTDGMAKVNTIAGLSGKKLDKLGKDLLQVSTDTGKSAIEITEAAYQALSASVPTEKVAEFTKTAAQLAKTGFTETASAVDVLSTAMNAYGKSAGTADSIANKLIQTQNDGKTTVNELASQLGNVIPTASALGVNIDNLTSSYVMLTKQGINTATATTGLKSMFNELSKSETTTDKVLQKITGKSFTELMKSGKSVGDVMKILSDSVNGDTTAFKNLFGNTKAGSTALALLNGGAEEFNAEIVKMGQSAGNMSKALDELATPSARAKSSINALKNASISLGLEALNAIAPMIEKVSNAIKSLSAWFSNLDSGTKQIVVAILAFITALGPVLIIIGKLMTAVGSIMTFAPMILSGVSGIMAVLVPVAPIVLGIIAAVVAVIAVIKNWSAITSFFQGVWKSVWTACSNAFSSFKSTVTGAVNAVIGFFTSTIPDAIGKMVKWFSDLPSKISSALSSVISAVSSWASGMGKKALKAGADFLKLYINNVILLPVKINLYLAKALAAVTKWAAQMASKALAAGAKFLSSVIKNLKTLPSKAASYLNQVISKLTAWASQMGAKGLAGARKLVSSVTSGVAGLPSKMVSVGRNVINGVIRGISGSVGRLYNSIKSAMSGLVSKAKKALGIASPSKVADKEIGQQFAEGVIAGVVKKNKKLKKTSEKFATKLYSSASSKLTALKKNNQITEAQEISFWETVVSSAKKGTKAYNSALSKLGSAKTALSKDIASLTETYIKDATKAYENYASTITKRQEDIVKSLSLFSNTEFEKKQSAESLTHNLERQVSALSKWDETLMELRKKLGDSDLLDELEAMGVSSLNNLETLNDMSADELKKYSDLYSQKNAIALKRAESENADLVNSVKSSIEKIQSTYESGLKKLGVTTTKQSGAIGKAITQGIADGLSAGKSDLDDTMSKVADDLIKKIKSKFKIASPSKIMNREIGQNLMLGIRDGIKEASNTVYDTLSNVASSMTGITKGLSLKGINSRVMVNASQPSTDSKLDVLIMLAQGILNKDTSISVNGRTLAKVVSSEMGSLKRWQQ